MTNKYLATAFIFSIYAITMTITMFAYACIGWSLGHLINDPTAGAMYGMSVYIWQILLNIDTLSEKLEAHVNDLVVPF